MTLVIYSTPWYVYVIFGVMTGVGLGLTQLMVSWTFRTMRGIVDDQRKTQRELLDDWAKSVKQHGDDYTDGMTRLNALWTNAIRISNGLAPLKPAELLKIARREDEDPS